MESPYGRDAEHRQTGDATWRRILCVTNVQNRPVQRGRVDSWLSGARGRRVRVAADAGIPREDSGVSTVSSTQHHLQGLST